MWFLDRVYEILFQPQQAFAGVPTQVDAHTRRDREFVLAVFIVLAVSVIGVVYSPFASSPVSLLFLMMASAFTGSTFWLLSALMFALPAYALGGQGKITDFLILLGYSSLPWLFLPILMVVKYSFGALGPILALLGVMVLSFWNLTLFLLAVRGAFQLRLDKALFVAALPWLLMFLSSLWVMGGLIYSLSHLTL